MAKKEDAHHSEPWRAHSKPFRAILARPWLIWLLPIIGLFSLVWFLIRVIPKPSRATYPCQRIAFPWACGFVTWVVGLAASAAAFRKAKASFLRSRYFLGEHRMRVAFSGIDQQESGRSGGAAPGQ